MLRRRLKTPLLPHHLRHLRRCQRSLLLLAPTRTQIMQLIWWRHRAPRIPGPLQHQIRLCQPRMLPLHLMMSPLQYMMIEDRALFIFYYLDSVLNFSFSFSSVTYLAKFSAFWTIYIYMHNGSFYLKSWCLWLVLKLVDCMTWVNCDIKSRASNKYVAIRRERTWIRGVGENVSLFDR